MSRLAAFALLGALSGAAQDAPTRCVLELNPTVVRRGDPFTATIVLPQRNGEVLTLQNEQDGFLAAFEIEGRLHSVVLNGLSTTLSSLPLFVGDHVVHAQVRRPRHGVSLQVLAQLYDEIFERQRQIDKLTRRIESGHKPLRRTLEVDRLQDEIQKIQTEIVALSLMGTECTATVTVQDSCTRIEFGILGDPALCLPAELPAKGNVACKIWKIVCCCIDEKSGYSATLHEGVVSEIRWQFPDDFIILEPTDATTVEGAKGRFISKLKQGELQHTVKVCVNREKFGDLIKHIGKDCYTAVRFEMSGRCVAGETVTEINMKGLFFIARSNLKVKVCVRNVKKKNAAADDPASSQNPLDPTFLKKLQDKLNEVYGQICLEFQVEKLDDLVLEAENFDQNGVLLTGDKAHKALSQNAKAGCVNIYVVGKLPAGLSGATPSVAKPPYAALDDSSEPVTYAHELGHFFGWKLSPSSLISSVLQAYGKFNVCRPPTAEKTDLLMYDNSLQRTDKGLLTEENLRTMQKLICENVVQ